MIASATDTTVFAAFAVGFVSFISPCVLPLVPGYLSAVSGVSIADLRAQEHARAQVLIPALVFCLSFSVVFVLLGASATSIGQTLNNHRDVLNRVAGASSASAASRAASARRVMPPPWQEPDRGSAGRPRRAGWRPRGLSGR